jgi:hypothetical protein
MLRRLLFNSDPADGGGDNSPAPAPAAPPAAAKVLESGAREGDAAELVELRRKLSETESAKRQTEMRNMELEDNLRTLTTPPTPTPKAKRSPCTFFDEETEGAD